MIPPTPTKMAVCRCFFGMGMSSGKPRGFPMQNWNVYWTRLNSPGVASRAEVVVTGGYVYLMPFVVHGTLKP